MRRKLAFTLSILLFTLSLCANNRHVAKKAAPSWVEPLSFENEISNEDEAEGGYAYLLFSRQQNALTKERHYKYAVKPFNSEGVQAVSDISADFDPTYEQFVFNKIVIHRKGEVIDKLPTTKINVYERETQHERALYDGSLTVVVNLSDVRIDDIIEYSYTVKGHNPIFGNNYFANFFLNFSVPIDHLYYKMIVPSSLRLNQNYEGQLALFKVENKGAKKIYTFSKKNVAAVELDSNVPLWFNVYDNAYFTTFNNWGDLVEWIEPHYRSSQKINIDKEIPLIKDAFNKEREILYAIQYVQNEIRYLGFESGMYGFKPRQPLEIVKNRYGDCKEKSVLLATIIKQLGYEAYPMLVNTKIGKRLHQKLPAAYTFDHCIVALNFEGKDYYIDPTINNQKGDLENYYCPHYKNGLVLKKGNKVLTPIPDTKKGEINVVEEFWAMEKDKPAQLVVNTYFKGSRADNTRAFLSYSSKKEVLETYKEAYAFLYPEIEAVDELSAFEIDDYGEGKLQILEKYEINNIWTKSVERENLNYIQFNPMVITEYLNYPHSAKRSMPYNLGSPVKIEQTIKLHLHEDYPLNASTFHVKNDAFEFWSTPKKIKNGFELKYGLQVFKEYIEADEVQTFLNDIETAKDNCDFFVYDGDVATEQGSTSWLAALLYLLVLIGACYLAYRVYVDYNPAEPIGIRDYRDLGGVLILLLIGLFISPIILLMRFFNGTYLNGETWWTYINPNSFLKSNTMVFTLFTEGVLLIFIFVFSILCLVLMLKRRSSFPRVYIGLRIFEVIFSILLVVVVALFEKNEGLKNSLLIELASAFGLALLSTVIWGTYLSLSERVKETFFITYKPKSSQIGQLPNNGTS